MSEDYINNGINDDIFKEQKKNNKQTNNKILINKTKTPKKREKKTKKNERRMDTCVQKKTNGLQNYEFIIESFKQNTYKERGQQIH